MIDENFRRALIVNKGDASVFFTNSWIAVVFAFTIIYVIIRQLLPETVSRKLSLGNAVKFVISRFKGAAK